MIRLKVFISSVQKELREERLAIGSFLATDEFLSSCTVPRIFEDYPQPLYPNPKAYLDLLRKCQVYVLILGKTYGNDSGDGLSATHEEYRLARELKLPTLVCVKGRDEERDPKARDFFSEIRKDQHTYSRFETEAKLLEAVGKRLREHIETTFAVEPRKAQEEQSRLTRQSASPWERQLLDTLALEDLDLDIAADMMAAVPCPAFSRARAVVMAGAMLLWAGPALADLRICNNTTSTKPLSRPWRWPSESRHRCLRCSM
jgi:hypothetical protein